MGEVKVHGKVLRDFLLKTYIGRIHPRIRVVFTKHANRWECRKSTRGRNIHDVGPNRQTPTVAATERGTTGNTELLRSVVSNRADLRQHILSAIENPGTRSKH